MRGSTRKRGSTWTALWDKQDPETGRRKQASKGGFRTQREAQRFLNETLPAVADGTYAEPSKQRLAAFLVDEWLPAIAPTVRPATQAAYRHLCQRYVSTREIGSVPLRSVSPAHLNALYAALAEEGLSSTTIRGLHTALRRAFRDAVRWRKLSRNPAADADPPKMRRGRAQAWTPSELRRFLAHVQGDRLYAMWRLGATTGLRRGELLGLTWQHLDLDAAELQVAQQLTPSMTFAPPKSKRSERTIALDGDTVRVLRKHLEEQQLERALAGDAYADHDLVFANELGQPISPYRATEWFTKHRKAAKIPVGHLHILRHTMATIALTEGTPLHVVAARLGDDPRTTLGVYSHLLPSSDSAAANAVASVLVDKALTSEPLNTLETAL